MATESNPTQVMALVSKKDAATGTDPADPPSPLEISNKDATVKELIQKTLARKRERETKSKDKSPYRNNGVVNISVGNEVRFKHITDKLTE